jgi:hypothetical protein
VNLLADPLIPDIAAVELSPIEPDLDVRSPQGGRDALTRSRIL